MNRKKNKILVVDDSRPDRELLQEILEQTDPNYEVWTVSSGKLALALIEQDPPDLILLDLQMTETNGFETMTEMKRRGKTIPVLLVSAFTEEGDRAKGLACGAVDFIDKPINVDSVRARVATHLKMKSNADTNTWAGRGAHQGFATALNPKTGTADDHAKPSARITADHIVQFQDSLSTLQQTIRGILEGKTGEINSQQRDSLAAGEKSLAQLLQILKDLPNT